VLPTVGRRAGTSLGGYLVRKLMISLLGIAAAAAAAATAIVPAGPALAAGTGSTTTTFTISTGTLSISVPATANMGTVASGSTHVSSLLGDVQVTDLRAALSGSWITTVSSTDFVTGTGTGPETVPNSDVTYDPGDVVGSSGTGTFTPGTPGTLAAPRTAFSATSEVGDTVVTWDPQITIQIPPGAVNGTYTGTITHSVA
jgi:hypothetical protein